MSENLTPLQSDEKFIAHYMTAKCKELGISQDRLAQKSNTSIDTVRNICTGKTTNPGIITTANMAKAVNGSLDEMCYGESANKKNESPTIQFLEQRIVELQRQHEKHVDDIRSHYEQHRQDYKDHTEHRLADKREIIAQQEEHIKSIKTENLYSKIFCFVSLAILICLLIAEVMNPNLGWIKF